MQKIFIRSAFLPLLLIPGKVLADNHFIVLDACWGGVSCDNLNIITEKFNVAFFGAAAGIALAIFLIGAFLMTISGGKDTLLQAGKRAMINSLVGLAIIVGCYGIYRTLEFLLY